MEKNQTQNAGNPFAQLKRDNFPDQKQENGKSNKNISYKIKTPQKNSHAPTKEKSFESEIKLEDDESSLFFANMANVQKLNPLSKEHKKKQNNSQTKEQHSNNNNENNSKNNSENSNESMKKDKEFLSYQGNNQFGYYKDEINNVPQAKNILPQNLNFVSERKIETALNLKGDISDTSAPFEVPHAFSQALSSQYKNNANDKASIFSPQNITKSKNQEQNIIPPTAINNKTNSTNNSVSNSVSTNSTNNNNNTNSNNTNNNNTNNDNPNSDDDFNLFFTEVSNVKSLHAKGREIIPEPLPSQISSPPSSNPLQDFMDEKLEFALHSTDDYIEAHVIGLDLMTLGKLQARQYSPEAHIDLHGLNCEQAYANLIAFFRNSYQRGLRTVLVVTGKGNKSINGTPVLRNKTQEWFTQAPFKRVILAFCSAKIEDGGSGALYVLIRKQKKDYGKIQWEVRPTDPDFFL